MILPVYPLHSNLWILMFMLLLLMVLPSWSIAEALLAVCLVMFLLLLMLLDLPCSPFQVIRLLTLGIVILDFENCFD